MPLIVVWMTASCGWGRPQPNTLTPSAHVSSSVAVCCSPLLTTALTLSTGGVCRPPPPPVSLAWCRPKHQRPLTFVSAYAQVAHRALCAAGGGKPQGPLPPDPGPEVDLEGYHRFEPKYTTMIPSFRNTLDYIFMQEGRWARHGVAWACVGVWVRHGVACVCGYVGVWVCGCLFVGV